MSSYSDRASLSLYAASDNNNMDYALRPGTVNVYVPFSARTKRWHHASVVVNATFSDTPGHETLLSAEVEKYNGTSWQGIGGFAMTGADETLYISNSDASAGVRLHFTASAQAQPYLEGGPAPPDVSCSITVTKMQISATYTQPPPNGKKFI